MGNCNQLGRRTEDSGRGHAYKAWVRSRRITDLETPLTALTPKRLHLLRYVLRHEVLNVRALAAGLRRNYKNAHKDVEELTRLGLLCRTPEKVLAPYAEIDARFVL